jgi:hypothetical protein
MVKVKNQQLPMTDTIYYTDPVHEAHFGQAYRAIANKAYVIKPATGEAVVRDKSRDGTAKQGHLYQATPNEAMVEGRLKAWKSMHALAYCSEQFAALPKKCADAENDYNGPTKSSVLEGMESQFVANSYIDLFNQCCIKKYNKILPPYDKEVYQTCFPAYCAECKNATIEGALAEENTGDEFEMNIAGTTKFDVFFIKSSFDKGIVNCLYANGIITATCTLNEGQDDGTATFDLFVGPADSAAADKDDEDACDSVEIKISNPCGSSHITSYLAYVFNGSTITLLVADPKEGTGYTWALFRNSDSSLYPLSGNTVSYHAQLKSGYTEQMDSIVLSGNNKVCDTIELTIMQSTVAYMVYDHMTYYPGGVDAIVVLWFNMFDCGDQPFTWSEYGITQASFMHLMQNIFSEPGEQQYPPCTAEEVLNDTIDPPILSPHGQSYSTLQAMMDANIIDWRTQLLINEGCNPEGLNG